MVRMTKVSSNGYSQITREITRPTLASQSCAGMFEVGLAGRSVPTTFNGSLPLRSAFSHHLSHKLYRGARFHNQQKPRLWLNWSDVPHISWHFGKTSFPQTSHRLIKCLSQISTVHFKQCFSRIISKFRGSMISLIYDKTLAIEDGLAANSAALTLMSTGKA